MERECSEVEGILMEERRCGSKEPVMWKKSVKWNSRGGGGEGLGGGRPQVDVSHGGVKV